jgi:uncharacterized protein YigE (DUF2233 family)
LYAAVLALLAACDAMPSATAPDTGATASSACSAVAFEGADFMVCTAVPGTHRITTVLAPAGGEPYRSFSAFAAAEPGRATRVAFAFNAGMFDDSGRPIGLYVEGGTQRHKLNRANGAGNFHLMPNGVFFGGETDWQVLETDRYAARTDRKPRFATQSGPMLVIDGKLHARFSADGESRFVRNGVGVDRAGKAHFAMSEQPVSFGTFARLFRDRLHTPQALFLDGNVSALWDPRSGRMDGSVPLGPLLVVEKAAKGGA